MFSVLRWKLMQEQKKLWRISIRKAGLHQLVLLLNASYNQHKHISIEFQSNQIKKKRKKKKAEKNEWKNTSKNVFLMTKIKSILMEIWNQYTPAIATKRWSNPTNGQKCHEEYMKSLQNYKDPSTKEVMNGVAWNCDIVKLQGFGDILHWQITWNLLFTAISAVLYTLLFVAFINKTKALHDMSIM